MRVLAITPDYPPASRVGAWLATHEWLRATADAGHDIWVVAQGYRGEPYEIDGVKVRRRDLTGYDLAGWADAIVCHLGDNGVARRLAESRRVPLIQIAHSVPPDSHRRLWGTTHLIANSQATADAIAWTGPTTICHPVTWPDNYRTRPGDRVTLINLAAAKGGKLFWELAHALPDVPFLGVKGGYGYQVPSPYGDLDNVELVETTADVREIYRRTRLLLVPSVSESWGMVAVEAMASGIPTIAHPSPGIIEALGDSGHLADRDHPARWAGAITLNYGWPRWDRLSAKALERSAELDPAASIKAFVETLEGLS